MSGIITIIGISILPFLYLFTQQQIVGNFTYAFANIAGFIGAVLLIWEFVLGIKDITKKLPINTQQFIRLHIFLGVWGMFFVLIHPILEMFIYMEQVSFLFLPDFSSNLATHITFGRIAFFFVILVWITSAFIRNSISYKKWLTIHYLSYPMMFFIFIHALDIGSFLNVFVGLRIYWISLLLFYIILCAWRVTVAIQNKNLTELPKK